MILDKIVEYKRGEVERLLRRGLPEYPEDIEPPRGFQEALASFPGLSLIAEVKKASPSKGIIRPDTGPGSGPGFDPVAIALAYEAGGAQTMSVLTDEHFFQGNLDYIPMVRRKVSLPVLRKDFLIHEIQIREAGIYGADAILLICAILEESQLSDYLALSRELGMDSLVEVHDQWELEKALKADSRMIGVNNRNLRDFSVDLETTIRVSKEVPEGIVVISESGIKKYGDIKKLQEYPISAVLVGETLMR
ncbi:MAG: indole-3-glycerol phosphate synthase TrpC, partial [Thermodesulfobacteriota bacterium]